MSATSPSSSPSAPIEGGARGEPGGVDTPTQYSAPLDQQQQASATALGRSVLTHAAAGNGAPAVTARKSAGVCASLLSRASSCLSYFNPLRGLLGRTLSYLTAQAVILAVVNGTIISFSSPLTTLPVICALVDEVIFNSGQDDRKCRLLVLEAVATAAIVAGAYSVFLPFKEHTIKLIPTMTDPEVTSSTPEMNTNAAIHMVAGAGAYASYRITHAVQRFLYET